MIITFSIENFRSFRGEETLSLVASTRIKQEHHQHLVPIPDEKKQVLRCSVLYGANGSGKSNLFRGLQTLRWVALESRGNRNLLPLAPFAFDHQTQNEPTLLDLQFMANGRIYRYGVRMTRQTIEEEWLLERDGNRDRPVFTRFGGTEELSAEVHLENKRIHGEKLKALSVVGCTPRQSFLAHVRNSLPKSDWGQAFKDVIVWFSDVLTLVAPEAKYIRLPEALSEDESFRLFSQNFLNEVSTGIQAFEVTRTTMDRDQFFTGLPEGLRPFLEKQLSDSGTAIDPRFVGSIHDLGNGSLELRKISSKHHNDVNEAFSLDLDEESDGTQRLLHLLPALSSVRKQAKVFVVDEIERSLHPLLVVKFIERFLMGCPQAENQLLVTSHESCLLDHSLLRRDEIWFVEKDKGQASHLTPLTAFKDTRRDLDLRKNYLQGRFDAIPFVNGVDKLFEAETQGHFCSMEQDT